MKIQPINNSYNNHNKPSFGNILGELENIDTKYLNSSYNNHSKPRFEKIMGLETLDTDYLIPLLNNPEFEKLADHLNTKGKKLLVRQWYANNYSNHLSLYESGFWGKKLIATIDSSSLYDNRYLAQRIELFSLHDINYNLTDLEHKLSKQANKKNFIQRLFRFLNKK